MTDDVSDDPAVAATVASGAGPADDALTTTLTEPGRTIGRFVVLEVLGQGAMGLVVAAYDPDLDRKVALKLLQPGAEEAMGTERLLREARAMAKLAHPNVLAIHEVGTVGEQVFLAMEFAAGGTLRAWCAAEPRGWRAVLERFVAAARGLDAAHQGGLVHRDFKPENVLLTAAGEVRVADFGLVGIRARAASLEEAGEERPADDTPLDVTLTRTGTLLGTPAYMAPEQFNRADVGPAADQFALCASLWEALYGPRPFPGRTYWELAAAVIGGNLSEPPADRDRDVPVWLREVMRRGLRAKPAERWPSMAALVEALERDPIAARRRRLRGIAAAAAVAALGGAVVFGLTRGDSTQVRCGSAAAAGATAWTGERRAAITTAFGERGAAWVGPTTGGLDGWVSRWREVRIDACRATHERGEQSPALLDKRMRCLDTQLVAFTALAGALGRADATAAEQALQAVDRLPAPETCTASRLEGTAGPSGDARAIEVERLLAEARAAVDLRAPDQVALADAALAAARELGEAAPLARALIIRADAGSVTDAASSRAAFNEALASAAVAHDPAIEATILMRSLTLAAEERDLPRVDALLPVARAAVTRAGDPDALRFELATAEFVAQATLARITEAREACDRSVKLAPADRRDATTAFCRCSLTRLVRDNAASVLACDENVSATLARYGERHPKVADARRYHISALITVEHYADALSAGHTNQALYERLYGARSRPVAEGLQQLAVSQGELGDLAAARSSLERALAIVEEVGGPDDPGKVGPLMELSVIAGKQKDLAAATRYADQGLATSERTFGSDNPDLATSLVFHAKAVGADPAQLDRALGSWDRALALIDRTRGPQTNAAASIASSYCWFLAIREQYAASIPLCKRALPVFVAMGDELNAARTQGLIGEVLLELGRIQEAVPELEAALKRFEALGQLFDDERATTAGSLQRARAKLR